ncbi:fatty acid desaturase [Ideonella sp. 4Y16]|uniref:Fatty acid desaturase n=1 Tax=Ideonella alba TaxID=2824118 RepID=A0A941BHV8_9BURK|nr:fatty acid desaturase [Ideonella alba]MBQ0933572.1 fatty acid desaturase [Ideonella alba]MBQ0946204.1 fatty acid desaturase [Ideonella alba]
MPTRSQVLSDIALHRQSLRRAGNPHLPLLELTAWCPIRDVAVDLVVIAAALLLTLQQPWAIPVSLLMLGNRQRALGNLLHDAAHRNFSRNRRVNDLVTRALIAPLLFQSLSRYRELHFRHHQGLGAAGTDPDLIPIPPEKAGSWVRAVTLNIFSLRAWLGSTWGHLIDGAVPLWRRMYVLAWWAALMAVLAAAVGAQATVAMLALWLAARATTFHVITTFREMCDHHGLTPGGVFSFTRDIRAAGLWSLLFHPRNNAYHLTHHLLPAVPYYRLPEAQRVFSALPEYRAKAEVCRTYFLGPAPAVSAWQRGSRA